MKKDQLLVSVEPEVLKWLIESSGWSKEEIAKKLEISSQSIDKFLDGSKKPSFKQLERLAKAFKRPIASFLLSLPIEEKPKPKDYRMIPGKLNKFHKKTILVMRKARNLQEICKELSRNVAYDTTSKIRKVKISESPEDIAEKYRKLFELTEEKQRKFKNAYELFNYLRDAFEEQNIFVFQFSMPIEDARGFVFADEYPYTIVVNSADSIEARVFSLMHEFGHILLGESSIDLPEANAIHENSVERWCNEFASSFLFPKEIANSVFSKYKSNLTETTTLKKISNRFKVSKAMLLLDMKKLNFITKQQYDDKINQFVMGYEKEKKGEKKSGGGISSETKCLSEVGNKFVSLVANNYDKEHITYTDALSYLSIKSKNFEKVLSKAKK